jgi:3-carboxy-cis,cis-muconate cycloisomerase
VPVKLIDSLATTEPLSEIFSDESVLQAMLEFEVALARAQARLGIIPALAVDAIASSARVQYFDVAALAHDTLHAGTPVIPLSKTLTEKVRALNADAAKFVHWGATSQDAADTALILLLKRTQPILFADLSKLEKALQTCSDDHAHTVMLGRTLLQAAPPVTFGLKAAGWLGAIRRSRIRLETSFAESLILQLGGASGTLASLADRGLEVAREVASELGLECPDAPWHTHRDRLANLMCSCGVLTGALGKMARDISLLMQNEVAELSEPGGAGRGGSSTMPHKRNPIGSTVTLAAANRVPGLVANYLSGMVQEHERAVGGWQAEWTTVAGVIQSTGLAAASMAEVAEGLIVDENRMRENIGATHGAVFAERAMMLLAPVLGRDVAHKIIEEATRKSAAEGRPLAEILRGIPEVTKVLDAMTLASLDSPEQYLGVGNELRVRLVSGHDKSNKK